MTGLHPTPTRLALLAAIKARKVTGYPTYDCGHVDYFWCSGPGQRGETVTAKVNEMIRAEWVPEYEPGPGGRTPDFKVKLTDLGEKVLAASRELDGSTHDGYPEVDRA
jgi:hypothetical protein